MIVLPTWRRLLQAGAMTVLFAMPAAAQMPNINLIQELPSKTPEEKERDEARDKAYRESLKKIPNAAPNANDPWGTVRSTEAAPKVAPKAPAKPKTAQAKRAKAETPAN